MNQTRRSDGARYRPSLFLLAFAVLLTSVGCSTSFAPKSASAHVALERLLPHSDQQLVEAERLLAVRTGPRHGWSKQDAQDGYRWQHQRLQDLLDDEPSLQRLLVRASKSDKPAVAATAQIGLARVGVGSGRQLVGIVHDASLPEAVRCAAVETLAREGFHGAVRALLGRRAPKDYRTSVHAELLHAVPEVGFGNVQQLAEDGLNSHSADVVRESIGLLLTDEAVPVEILDLVSAAESNRRSVARVAAIEMLGRRRMEAAVEMLIDAVKDDQYAVRVAAMKALGRIDSERSLDTLRAMLLDQKASIQDRQAALIGLGLAGNLDEVYDFASDESWQLRHAVAEVLGRGPSVVAVSIAEELISDRALKVAEQTMRSLARWPIEQSGPLLMLGARVDSRLQLRKLALQQLADKLAHQGRLVLSEPDDFDLELATLRRKWEQRFGLLADYWKSYNNELYTATPRDADSVTVDVQALASNESWVRQKAVQALLRQARRMPLNAAGRRSLMRAVKQTKDPVVWKTALLSVGKAASLEAEQLMKLACAHHDPEIRQVALEYVVRFPDRKFGPLTELMLDDPDPAVRRTALRSAQAIPGQVATSLIRAHLLAKDPDERALAAAIIWQQDPRRGKTTLIEMSADRDPDVRRAVAQVIGENRIRPLRDMLFGLLNDVPKVQEAAATALMEVVDDEVAVLKSQQLRTVSDRVKYWQAWHRSINL